MTQTAWRKPLTNLANRVGYIAFYQVFANYRIMLAWTTIPYCGWLFISRTACKTSEITAQGSALGRWIIWLNQMSRAEHAPAMPWRQPTNQLSNSANYFLTYNYRIISRKFLPKDVQKWEKRTIWLSQMSRAELAPTMPWRQPNKQREQSQACLSYAESRMRSNIIQYGRMKSNDLRPFLYIIYG